MLEKAKKCLKTKFIYMEVPSVEAAKLDFEREVLLSTFMFFRKIYQDINRTLS